MKRLLPLLLLPGCFCVRGEDDIRRAFEHLYNFEFARAQAAASAHIENRPDDPAGYSMRASIYLFQELDRMSILEAEFFADDKRFTSRKRPAPDPGIRRRFEEAVNRSEVLARALLARSPKSTDGLFAMCTTAGLMTDYLSLVEKRNLASLSYLRQSNRYAMELLQVDPTFVDAYLTPGSAEYLMGSLPFFVRWFVRIDGVEGSKDQAVEKLRIVVARGRYLGPFAKILLSIIHLREKRPEESFRLLGELTRDYPGNPLLRREYDKLNGQLRRTR